MKVSSRLIGTAILLGLAPAVSSERPADTPSIDVREVDSVAAPSTLDPRGLLPSCDADSDCPPNIFGGRQCCSKPQNVCAGCGIGKRSAGVEAPATVEEAPELAARSRLPSLDPRGLLPTCSVDSDCSPDIFGDRQCCNKPQNVCAGCGVGKRSALDPRGLLPSCSADSDCSPDIFGDRQCCNKPQNVCAGCGVASKKRDVESNVSAGPKLAPRSSGSAAIQIPRMLLQAAGTLAVVVFVGRMLAM